MWISLRPKATGSPGSCQRGRTWANIMNHLQGKPAFSFQLQTHSALVSQEIFGMWDFKSPQENTPTPLAEFWGTEDSGGPEWTCFIVEGSSLFLKAVLSPETHSGTPFPHPPFLCPLI